MDGWLGCADKGLGWLCAGKNQRPHVSFQLQSLNVLLVSPLFSALFLPHPLPTSWSQTHTLSLASYCSTSQLEIKCPSNSVNDKHIGTGSGSEWKWWKQILFSHLPTVSKGQSYISIVQRWWGMLQVDWRSSWGWGGWCRGSVQSEKPRIAMSQWVGQCPCS